MPAKILIVDDDEVLHILLQNTLARYETRSALSGEKAQALIAGFQPELIILDVNMPGVDGYETCKKIRETISDEELPILFLSTNSQLEDKIRGYESGGNDYITKPFDIQILLKKIEQALAYRTQALSLRQKVAQSNDMIESAHNDADKLRAIASFSQNALFCGDIDALCEAFFEVAGRLGIKGILRIESNDRIVIKSDNGMVSQIENDILALSRNLDQVFYFGKNRAVINWINTSFLVKNFNEEWLDKLQMLMNTLEGGMTVIRAEQDFINAINTYTSKNYQLQLNVIALFEGLVDDLKSQINAMGAATALSEMQENALIKAVDTRISKVDTLFRQGLQQEEDISKSINVLCEARKIRR